MRDEALDHGTQPQASGLGKTTMALCYCVTGISNKRLVCHWKAGDLVAILNDLEPGDTFSFIGEIHRLPMSVERLLYSAMGTSTLTSWLGLVRAVAVSFDLPPLPWLDYATCGALKSSTSTFWYYRSYGILCPRWLDGGERAADILNGNHPWGQLRSWLYVVVELLVLPIVSLSACATLPSMGDGLIDDVITR